MKKTLRIAAVVLAVVMTLTCFAACGSKDNETKTDDKVYQIVADDAFAPFEYLDEATGAYIGVDMDILAAIAADQGFKYTVDNCGWDAALGNLGSGSADGMIAGMTITDERKETYDFTDGYFEDGQILYTKADSTVASLEDLAGLTVAVKTGTQGAAYAEEVKDQYGFTIVSYEGSAEMYQAVMGGIDAAGFEDYSVMSYTIQAQGLDLKTVGEPINVKPYGLAVPKGENAELVEMFNAGLKNIKDSGEYDEILAKYGM